MRAYSIYYAAHRKEMADDLFGTRTYSALSGDDSATKGSVTVSGFLHELFLGQGKWLLYAGAVVTATSTVALVQAQNFLNTTPEEALLQTDNAKIAALSQRQRQIGREALTPPSSSSNSSRRAATSVDDDFYRQLQRLVAIDEDEDLKDEIKAEEAEVIAFDNSNSGSGTEVANDADLAAKLERLADTRNKVTIMRNVEIGLLVTGLITIGISVFLAVRQTRKVSQYQQVLRYGDYTGV